MMRIKRLGRLPMIRLAHAAGFFATVALAGCAQQPFADDSPAKQSAALIGVANVPPEPKEFVRTQRSTAPDFIPVGVTPPQRAVAPRDAAAAAALEAELNAQRNRSRGFAARPRPRSTYDGSIPPRPAPPPKELLPQ